MATNAGYAPKISPRNKQYADNLRALAKKFSIIGVVDVQGLPAPQFQDMRGSLKKSAEIVIVKKNVAEIVLKELESQFKGISKLVEKMDGIVGLIFTNDNPFSLYKFVQKNKSQAPARAGQKAPKSIVVPKGPTPFSPGPIIGELGKFKIKAGINAGKVEIKEDSIVAKEGDVISAELAGILTRLNIQPMEVGLNIKAVYEKGLIYGASVLAVDEKKVLADLEGESLRCFKLAFGLGYYSQDTIELFVEQGFIKSLALAVKTEFPSKDEVEALVAKHGAQQSAAHAVAATPVAANEGKKEEEKKEASSADIGAFF
jgi:large subunit ribosomal protein L10